MIQRGYDLLEAFTNPVDSSGSRTLVNYADSNQDVAYGIKHVPAANVKIYNASRNPDSSIALSFSPVQDSYDDVLKLVKKPQGGYEMHLNKITTLVIDGKRVDTTTLSKFL